MACPDLTGLPVDLEGQQLRRLLTPGLIAVQLIEVVDH